MFHLERGENGEAWMWRRRLLAWEEDMLVECKSILHDVFLQVDIQYRWLWLPDLVKGFTVRGAYNLIISDSDDPYQVAAAPSVIWIREISLKVSLFV